MYLLVHDFLRHSLLFLSFFLFFFFIYIFVPFFYFLFGTLDVFPILLVDSAPIANTFVGAEKCN